jgi:hypothetical protein
MSRQVKRIFILGIGDVGFRIAQMTAERGLATDLRLAGHGESHAQWARLLQLGTSCRTSAVTLDGMDEAALSTALADFAPHLIIQCATLLAPFAFIQCGSDKTLALARAGFAFQTSAQLPIVMTLMKARKKARLDCPVVNGSFPDATNPMLARLGLAPTVGVGNVAIIARLLESARPKPQGERLKVIAHHPQLLGFIRGELPRQDLAMPLVHEDGKRLSDDVLKIPSGLKIGPSLNYLVAVTALPIIEGLLDPSRTIETHAPGILGLEGGYPVMIRNGEIVLDLPAGVTTEEAVAFNRMAGRGDAIERIEQDGTLVYTEAARRVAAGICPELGEPLHPDKVMERFEVLDAFVRECRRA